MTRPTITTRLALPGALLALAACAEQAASPTALAERGCATARRIRRAIGRTLRLGAATLLLTVPVSGCEDSASATVGPDFESVGPMSIASLSQAISPNIGERQGFEVIPLSPRSTFPDPIDMTLRIRLDGRATNVAHVRDPSDVVFVQGTFAEGGSAGWHTHPGPGIIAVRTGRLGIINASDCVLRIYETGQALIDPGQGNVHVGFNALSEGEGETIIVVAFLDVPPGEPVSTPAPDPGC